MGFGVGHNGFRSNLGGVSLVSEPTGEEIAFTLRCGQFAIGEVHIYGLCFFRYFRSGKGNLGGSKVIVNNNKGATAGQQGQIQRCAHRHSRYSILNDLVGVSAGEVQGDAIGNAVVISGVVHHQHGGLAIVVKCADQDCAADTAELHSAQLTGGVEQGGLAGGFRVTASTAAIDDHTQMLGFHQYMVNRLNLCVDVLHITVVISGCTACIDQRVGVHARRSIIGSIGRCYIDVIQNALGAEGQHGIHIPVQLCFGGNGLACIIAGHTATNLGIAHPGCAGLVHSHIVGHTQIVQEVAVETIRIERIDIECKIVHSGIQNRCLQVFFPGDGLVADAGCAACGAGIVLEVG